MISGENQAIYWAKYPHGSNMEGHVLPISIYLFIF
jgi:hypothetical protein